VTYRLQKDAAGHYRLSGHIYYAPIRRQGGKWYAEIRRQSDGELVRYAGIWSTLKDATGEAESVMERL
jgi:hypothetical protein